MENISGNAIPKFSLVGNGFISPRHILAIQRVGGEIVGRDCGENFISILTPNYLHYQMVKDEVAKGKIVLCEKPLSLTSEHIQDLMKLDNVYTVLQLRHHPLLKEIKVEEQNEVEMDISVYRDLAYFQSWKGDITKSGGILFNLGIHYFDLLLHLFHREGVKINTETKYINDKLVFGSIFWKGFYCKWKLCLDEDRDNQRRIFKINGVDYNFSSQDNLSMEDLHIEVYRELLQGRGVKPKDVLEVTSLIEKLYVK